MFRRSTYWLLGAGMAGLLVYAGNEVLSGRDVTYRYQYFPDSGEMHWEVENEEVSGVLGKEDISGSGVKRYTFDMMNEQSIHVRCTYKSGIPPLTSSNIPKVFDEQNGLLKHSFPKGEKVFDINPRFDFDNPESVSIYKGKENHSEVFILPVDRGKFCRDSLESLLEVG